MGFFDNRELDAQLKRVDDWGIVEATEADEGSGVIVLHRMQDCEPILDQNARDAAEMSFDRRGWGKLAARIPNLVIEQWCQMKGVSYATMMSREGDAIVHQFLNDPAFSRLRIWDGHL